MKTTAARYIDASKEVEAKLAKIFNCSDKLVYQALTYRSDSVIAKKIRYSAVKYYGATPMCHMPLCETFHDTTENGRPIMKQVFNNGAILRVDKSSGNAWISNNKGECLDLRLNIDFKSLAEMQVMAESI